MKKTKIWYWIVTVIILLFILSSAIPEILKTKDGVGFVTALGYPEYFVPFLGIAKVLGIIAVLIPSRHWLKEWAYAGLFFDLFGATYSIIAVGGMNSGVLIMVVAMALLMLSHYLWKKFSCLPAGREF